MVNDSEAFFRSLLSHISVALYRIRAGHLISLSTSARADRAGNRRFHNDLCIRSAVRSAGDSQDPYCLILTAISHQVPFGESGYIRNKMSCSMKQLYHNKDQSIGVLVRINAFFLVN